MATFQTILSDFCVDYLHLQPPKSLPQFSEVILSFVCAEGQSILLWHQYTLGPLNIRPLEIFLGYASPCLMGLFTTKNLMHMFEHLPVLRHLLL
jgi:hypothetical protein